MYPLRTPTRVLVCFALALAACATGGGDDYVPGIGDDGGNEGGGSGSGGSSGGSGGSSGSGSSSGSNGSSSGSSSGGSSSGSSSGTSSGGTDAGDDGGGSSSSGSSSGGSSSGGSCSATNACASAMQLGTFGGDVSGATLTATGSTSEWLSVDATEQDSSPLAVPMKLTATLTSPAGANFDLYAYLGSKSAVQCTMVKASSTNTSGTDTLSFEWGETGTFANGVDDSAWVALEVRWVSGTCSSTDTWSLSTHGH